jgi:hypothetical protein
MCNVFLQRCNDYGNEFLLRKSPSSTLSCTLHKSILADWWTGPNSDLHTRHIALRKYSLGNPCRPYPRCYVSYRQTKDSILDTIIMLNETPGHNPTSENILRSTQVCFWISIIFKLICYFLKSPGAIRLYGRPPVLWGSSVLSSFFRFPSSLLAPGSAPWLSRNFFLVGIPPAVLLILGYWSIVNRRSFSHFPA